MFRLVLIALLCLPLASAAQGTNSSLTPVTSTPTPAPGNWIASWATSQQGLDGPPPQAATNATDAAKLTDITVRQTVHLSAGGSSVRVVLSNAFGTQPLSIDASAIALGTPGASATLPNTTRALSFGGQPETTIPAGSVMISDPVALAVPAMGSLDITFHLPSPPHGDTTHPGSRATSFLLPGNHVMDSDLPSAEKVVRWMQLAEVDVTGPARSAVVALGDSITDGHACTTDGNDRWTDVLAARLQAVPNASVAVVNEGIGGNHLLTNGIGQSALERLDRDLLAVAGVRSVLVLEGINDLGALARNPAATQDDHTRLVARMEGALTQIIERAHAHGIQAYGATITPDGGSDYYHPNAMDEAARLAVNTWIRQPGHFDGFVDFDGVTRDPAHPDHLLPAFDSGDHLHPGPAGYKAMGEAVPLTWFR